MVRKRHCYISIILSLGVKWLLCRKHLSNEVITWGNNASVIPLHCGVLIKSLPAKCVKTNAIFVICLGGIFQKPSRAKIWQSSWSHTLRFINLFSCPGIAPTNLDYRWVLRRRETFKKQIRIERDFFNVPKAGYSFRLTIEHAGNVKKNISENVRRTKDSKETWKC